MNTKAMIGGISLMLLAMSMNVNAYHITGAIVAPGTSATSWANAGNGQFVVQCESDGPGDPVNALPASQGGLGGLCTADSGYATPGGFPPVGADEPAITLWGSVAPVVLVAGAGINTSFQIRIANNNNQCIGDTSLGAADTFLYQELYAFWANNGHVTFFMRDPGASGTYAGATGLADPLAGYCTARDVTALG